MSIKMTKDDNNIITYDSQLDFKKWALEQLGTKEDIFYFDYVYGVDSSNDREIEEGLYADGTMTWAEGLEVLKKHFGFSD